MKVRNVLLGITLLSVTLLGCSNNKGGTTPTPEVNYYKIVWKNYNGTVLETDTRVRENTMPSYDGATPTKPEDANYTYTWNGWTPSVVPATRDATYKATFTSTPKGPQKVTVAAHTLRDTNPPIDVDSIGQEVDEDTWESFRNAPDSKFNDNYNYTYKAYSNYVLTAFEEFTKDGYHVKSTSGELYYERKSGSTFYEYISRSDGWLRQETGLDLPSKYIYRIQQEIYVHMFDFNNYEYDSYDGTYYYLDYGFGATVKFQGGYLTFLTYSLGSTIFRIEASFETTINIPASYYFK